MRKGIEILKTIAEGKNRWGEIKRGVGFIEGIEIDDKISMSY
jgi:hypothetical protein